VKDNILCKYPFLILGSAPWLSGVLFPVVCIGYSCEQRWFNLFVDIQVQQDAPTQHKESYINCSAYSVSDETLGRHLALFIRRNVMKSIMIVASAAMLKYGKVTP
jgi:hypothetical protein